MSNNPSFPYYFVMPPFSHVNFVFIPPRSGMFILFFTAIMYGILLSLVVMIFIGKLTYDFCLLIFVISQCYYVLNPDK